MTNTGSVVGAMFSPDSDLRTYTVAGEDGRFTVAMEGRYTECSCAAERCSHVAVVFDFDREAARARFVPKSKDRVAA